jgi:hypothetical protein
MLFKLYRHFPPSRFRTFVAKGHMQRMQFPQIIYSSTVSFSVSVLVLYFFFPKEKEVLAKATAQGETARQQRGDWQWKSLSAFFSRNVTAQQV